MEYTAYYDSPLGTLTLTFVDSALTGLRLSDNLASLEHLNNLDNLDVRRWLDLYFSGQKPDFTPPIRLLGTDFQRRVWQALLTISYGQTTTYGELARRVGCRSAQAVGQAVGRNPIAIIVPCHRVVGSDGSLTGYAYGLERKEYLLKLEARGN